MSNKLYQIINLTPTVSNAIHLRTSDVVQFLPTISNVSIYIKSKISNIINLKTNKVVQFLSNTLNASVYISSIKSNIVNLRTNKIIKFFPITLKMSIYIQSGVKILTKKFSLPIIKTKILNWRLPDQTVTVSAFDFMDGSSFDFMDGTDFDFMET